MSNFKSTENKGFQMTFENGWTISVQFGYGNYCDNNHHPEGLNFHLHTHLMEIQRNFSKKQEVTESSDAEIAIWDADGEWYNFGSDTVKGYCTADEVATWIKFTADQGK